jgi:hypothetical protein
MYQYAILPLYIWYSMIPEVAWLLETRKKSSPACRILGLPLAPQLYLRLHSKNHSFRLGAEYTSEPPLSTVHCILDIRLLTRPSSSMALDVTRMLLKCQCGYGGPWEDLGSVCVICFELKM